MATAEINGIPVRYEDSGGTGDPLLFSHGFLMDHSMFDHQVAHLAADYRCVRWDERGFGETPANGDFSYWDSASDAAGVLDACGVDSAVWIGMSQGGFLSLRGALAYPERVRALVLIDTQAGLDPPETLAGYEEMAHAMMSSDDDVFGPVSQVVAGLILGSDELAAEWIPRWSTRRDHDLLTPMRTLSSRDDITDRLGEISCPSWSSMALTTAPYPSMLPRSSPTASRTAEDS